MSEVTFECPWCLGRVTLHPSGNPQDVILMHFALHKMTEVLDAYGEIKVPVEVVMGDPLDLNLHLDKMIKKDLERKR